MLIVMVILVDLEVEEVLQVAWVCANDQKDAITKAMAAFKAAGFEEQEGRKYHLHVQGVGPLPEKGPQIIQPSTQDIIKIAKG